MAGKSAILSVKVVGDARDFSSTMDTVSSKTASIAGAIGKTFAGVAAGVAAVGVSVAGLAIKGGIDRQLQIEDATAKLAGLGNSADTVKTIMDNALASVKGTAFGMGEAATVAAGATAAGIKPGKDLERVLKLTGDAATIAGTSMGDMGAIFNKVASSGKLTGDVVNQLQDKGFPILQMVAKQYGVTAEEASKMVSKGKVDFAGFSAAIEANVGGAALKSGNTTKGAFANMNAALSRVGVTLSAGFFPLIKDVFNQITLILDGMNERIKPAAEAFGKWFAGVAGPAIAGFSAFVLGKMDIIIGGIRAFGAAWKYNDGDITSTGFAGFMERAAFFTHQLVDAVRQLDFSSFSAFLASLSAAGGTAGGAFASIGASLQTLTPAFQKFLAMLPQVSAAAVKLAGVGLGILVAGLGFLADHVDTIIAWMPVIVAGFVAWKMASKGLADAQLAVRAGQVAMTPVTTVNNVLRLIAINQERQLAAATTASSAAIAENTVAQNTGILARVRGAAAAAASAVAMGAQRVAMVAGTVAMGIATAAQWAWNAAMSANPIMLIVLAVVALVAGLVWFFTQTQIGQAAWAAFTDFLGSAIKVAGDVIGAVFTWVGQAWNNTISFLSAAWSNVWNFVLSLVRGAINGVAGIIGGIAGVVSGIVGFISGAFSGAFNAVQNVVGGVIGWITGAFGSIVNAVQNVIGWVSRLFNGFAVPGWLRDVMRFMGVGGTGFGFDGEDFGGFPGAGPGTGATGFLLSPAPVGGSAGAAPVINNITVTIQAGPGTDRVAMGRELMDLLRTYSRATATKGAISFG